MPSESIKVLDVKKKPRTFAKNVISSDIIIIDILSGTDFEDAEQMIKILRQQRTEETNKSQVLIIISPIFTWANTQRNGAIFTDADFTKRIPFPKF